jgi:mannonate dehydratase
MSHNMRLALGQLRELSVKTLRFIRQLGVGDVILNTPDLPGDARWEFMDLLHLRMRCEDAGLALAAIENVPRGFYEKAMLGLSGRDEQIENVATTIRNMGQAGIPILGYNWMPNGVWRTSRTTLGRGGATVTSFDMELAKSAPLSHGRVYTTEEMWRNYEYFLRAIVPVAEEAGIRLALHPDDPPVPSLGGVSRIFKDFDDFRRAMHLMDSPVNGLDFCLGCWSEMGPGVLEAVRYFGERGKILYVHFRDVQGTVPAFQECFINEGNNNMFLVLKTLKESGFSGFLIPDHVPHMTDDTEWGHRGRAYAIGYMSALLEVLDSG